MSGNERYLRRVRQAVVILFIITIVLGVILILLKLVWSTTTDTGRETSLVIAKMWIYSSIVRVLVGAMGSMLWGYTRDFSALGLGYLFVFWFSIVASLALLTIELNGFLSLL